MQNPRTVLNWYDFLCPFCYIAQHRNEIFIERGFSVVELPFQAHPNIPSGGISLGPRQGSMYSRLEREAREAGLPLRWPSRLPNTRSALAAAEWARRYQPEAFPKLHSSLFLAHFAYGEDLGNPLVIDAHASGSGIDLQALHAALGNGSAERFVTESEELGRRHGVQGTPAWLVRGQLIAGLSSVQDFQRTAEAASIERKPHHES